MPDPITPAEIAELREKLAKAAARPWQLVGQTIYGFGIQMKDGQYVAELSSEGAQVACFSTPRTVEEREGTAESIVSLANLADRLLSTLEAETERRVSAEGALKTLVANHDGFMTANDGFIGNQSDAYYRLGKRFTDWNAARAHFSRFTSEPSAGGAS